MIKLDGYCLKVSKGDTFALAVSFSGAALPTGTRVLFTIRANPGDAEAIIEKTILAVGEAVMLRLSREETDLPPGRYAWDIRVVFPDDVVVTPFPPALFEILEVVGHVADSRA